MISIIVLLFLGQGRQAALGGGGCFVVWWHTANTIGCMNMVYICILSTTLSRTCPYPSVYPSTAIKEYLYQTCTSCTHLFTHLQSYFPDTAFSKMPCSLIAWTITYTVLKWQPSKHSTGSTWRVLRELSLWNSNPPSAASRALRGLSFWNSCSTGSAWRVAIGRASLQALSCQCLEGCHFQRTSIQALY